MRIIYIYISVSLKSTGRTSQQKLLAGAVIRKRSGDNTSNEPKENPPKRSRPENEDNNNEGSFLNITNKLS